MRKIAILILMLLLTLATNAQLALKVGLDANAAMGSTYWSGGPGVDAGLKYFISKHFDVGFSSGFQHFFPTSRWGDGYKDQGINLVPLRFSIDYYFGEKKFKPYVGLELGPNLVELQYTYSYEYYDAYEDEYYSEYEKNDASKTQFGAAPILGFYINFGNSKVGADISARYNFISAPSGSDNRRKLNNAAVYAGLVFKFW